VGVECLAGSKDGNFEAVCSLTFSVGRGRKSDFDVFNQQKVLQNATQDNIWQGW